MFRRTAAGAGAGKTCRAASHAGSWYSSDGAALNQQLTQWLEAAGPAQLSNVRGIIGPHAGYSYSGSTAAYAYREMQAVAGNCKRVFLLGPSHHVYLDNCALPSVQTYETPLGNIELDLDVVEELAATNRFRSMTREVDEDEHSLEMHLPYIYKAMEGHAFKLVPIMVGALSQAGEQEFGQILAPYVRDPNNFFVVSSDFCHWGSRFSYTPIKRGYEDKIHEGIESMDREGMHIIESLDAPRFARYLKETKNTICGRHPIAVLMNALAQLEDTDRAIKFLHYEQSSAVRSKGDSSVSYASAGVSVGP